MAILNDFNGEKDRVVDAKKCVEEFFGRYLIKLKDSLVGKENVFRVDGWKEFCESDKYEAYLEVVQKYYTKYSESSLTAKITKQQPHRYEPAAMLQKYKQACYNILKQVEEIGCSHKEQPKKSLKSSSSYNSTIQVLYNLEKCV